jgi:hypothetical protein
MFPFKKTLGNNKQQTSIFVTSLLITILLFFLATGSQARTEGGQRLALLSSLARILQLEKTE